MNTSITSQELEVQLKALDPRFSVVPNPGRPGLSNIFFDGRNFDLPAVSTTTIKEEIDHTHRYEFPNGMTPRHHSRPEIMARVEDFLKKFNEGTITDLYE